MAQLQKRTAAINLRALDSQCKLIDRTVALSGKSRSDFMLEIACREAENILLNQNLFMLNENDFDSLLYLIKLRIFICLMVFMHHKQII